MKLLSMSICMVLAGAAVAAEAGPPEFTRKPAASRAGGEVKIEFSVDRATDVAVFIKDEKGNVVRHLVAGVLGENPPAPLKPNSLEQSIVWDGKADYGMPAGAGPFKVRVALGLGAEFDKVLLNDPQALGGIKALAVGPDGTVYVVNGAGGTGPVWSGQVMVAFDRNGKYLRQLMPFPADLTMDQVKGFDVYELNGRPVPLVHNIQRRSFYGSTIPRKAGMAVTPDGVILTILPNCNLGALDGRGGAPWGKYVGPSLQPKVRRARLTRRPFVAAGSDGKFAFVSGLVDQKLDEKGHPKPQVANAIYRVRLPERSPADPFFGDPKKTGDDPTHLGGPPRGLATDGKGHLLIADHANNRVVVVNESDGQFAGSFKVDSPDCVAADPTRGAVYVTRLLPRADIELVKFSGWKEGKLVTKLKMKREANPDFPWLMAMDPGGAKPIVWLGGDGGSLLRVEDNGDALGQPVKVTTGAIGNGSFVDLSVDRVRDEVYTRCGMYWWYRINDRTGETTKVKPGPYPSAAGSQLVPGQDGSLYSPAYAYHLLRFDRAGKPLPWPGGGYPSSAPGKQKGTTTKITRTFKHGTYAPVSMTFLTHTLGVRHDGHIFVFEPGHAGGRPPKMLIEYLPDGQRVDKPIIWKVSDTAVGPKFDPQGNIYIAEQVKPPDQPYPPEFNDIVGEVKLSKTYLEGIKNQVPSMYGSIVKFSPKGGMIHFGGENPFAGSPSLDASLKTLDAAYYQGRRHKPVKVTGATWMRMGVSHVDLIACNCENTRFDVDEFARVFYPDLGRFRVGVLDTNGNPITHFGRYGNADTDDAIAFTWLIGVGVTDRHAYMGDSLDKRLLRAKLVYAAEETCDVP